MLSKPDAGWTNITIGEFRSRASYLTDIPFDCLQAFIFALKHRTPAAISFDAEGWEFIVVVDWYDTHVIINNTDAKYEYKTIEVKKEDLAKELYDDIDKNFEAWVAWDDEGYSSAGARESRLQRLAWLHGELKSLLTKSA